MKTIIYIISTIYLSLWSVKSIAESTSICYNQSIPPGWIVTARNWDSTRCGATTGTGSFDNVFTITKYQNLAVGTNLLACTSNIPPGWELTGTSNGTMCSSLGLSAQYNLYHKYCSGQTNIECFGTASISANPSTVYIPYNATAGSTSISITTSGTYNGTACAYVSQNGQSESSVSCFGVSKVIIWDNVPKDGNSTFIVRTTDGSKTEIGRLRVNGISLPKPSLSTSPAGTVIVPWGKTEAQFTLQWNAPGYNSLDWCGKVNSGAWASGLVTNGSGSSTQPIGASVTYGYRIYGPGQAIGCSASTFLAETSIIGVAGIKPTFVASPADVKIPYPNNTGSFSLMWNAPGFAYIDWHASINGGPFFYGLSSAPSGSVTENISVGTVYSYRFYEGGTTNLLGTLIVTGSR